MRPGASSAAGTHSPRVSALTGNFWSVTQGNSHLFWLVASARRSRTTLSCEQDFPVDGRYLWGRSRGGFLGKFSRSVFGFLVDIEWVFREKLSIHNDFWVNNKSCQQNPNDFGPQTQLQNPQTAMPVCVCGYLFCPSRECCKGFNFWHHSEEGRKEGSHCFLWWCCFSDDFAREGYGSQNKKLLPKKKSRLNLGIDPYVGRIGRISLNSGWDVVIVLTCHRSYRSVLRQISMIECTNQ